MAMVEIDQVWSNFCILLLLCGQLGLLSIQFGQARRLQPFDLFLEKLAALVLPLLLSWGVLLLWMPDRLIEHPLDPLRCATLVTLVVAVLRHRLELRGLTLIAATIAGLIHPLTTLGFAGRGDWLSGWAPLDLTGAGMLYTLGGWLILAALWAFDLRKEAGHRLAPVTADRLPAMAAGGLLLAAGCIGLNISAGSAQISQLIDTVNNSLLAGVVGTLVAALSVPQRRQQIRWMISMQGGLAGMISVSGSGHRLVPLEALFLGGFAAATMLMINHWLRRSRLDDPLCSVAVLLGGGTVGLITAGLPGVPSSPWTDREFWLQITLQLFGVTVIALVGAGLSWLLFSQFRRWRLVEMKQPDVTVEVSPRMERLLAEVDQHGRQGYPDRRLKVEEGDEVGLLAGKYNEVMERLESSMDFARLLVRDLQEGLITCSTAGQVLQMNPAAERLFAMAAADVQGASILNFLAFDQSGVDKRVLLHDGFRQDLTLLRGDGDRTRVLVSVTESRRGQHGRFLTVLMQDVQTQWQVREQLQQESNFAQLVLESIIDSMITLNLHGRVTYLNQAAGRLLGWSAGDATGLPLARLISSAEDQAGRHIADLAEYVLRLVAQQSRGEVLVLCNRYGDEFHLGCSLAPILNRADEQVGVVVLLHDVTQDRQFAQLLSYQATHDTLTGLYNRHAFEAELSSLLEESVATRPRHVLCLGDLDQFKVINDSCGHAAGDELLRQLTSLMRSKVRERDMLARVGGDEFGLLLQNCEIERAEKVVADLIATVADYRFVWHANTYAVGISFGITPIDPAHGDTIQIMNNADAACFAAKDAGRNRFHRYEPSDEELSRRMGEMSWVSRIQQALDADQFELYCQEIRPLSDDLKPHYEVLVRLRTEDGKLVGPGAFVPAAERYGLIQRIDRWVVSKVLEWLKREEARLGDIRLAVNLSGFSVGDETFHAALLAQISQVEVARQRICFEITETAAITSFNHAVEFLNRFKALGFRFALDDFGSGVSSFAYLHRLPIDLVKIDGIFVRELLADEMKQSIVTAIVQISAQAGLLTIAEFVEDDATLAWLRAAGVNYAQGNGVSMPFPLDELLA